jgi:large subunit ribosomal protein L29
MAGLKKHKEELRGKSLGELREVLVGAKEELFNLRFQRATGNLENHRNIRKAKREIARVHTMIREMELAEASKGDSK